MGWILLGVLGASLGACALLSSGGSSTPPPPPPQFSVASENNNALYNDIGGKDTSTSQKVYTVEIISPKTFRIKASGDAGATGETFTVTAPAPFYIVKNDCATTGITNGSCQFTVQYRPADKAKDYNNLAYVTVKDAHDRSVKTPVFGVPTSILNPSAPIHIDTKTSNIGYNAFAGVDTPKLAGYYYIVNGMPKEADPLQDIKLARDDAANSSDFSKAFALQISSVSPCPAGGTCGGLSYSYTPRALWGDGTVGSGVKSAYGRTELSFTYDSIDVKYTVPQLLESYGSGFLVDQIATLGSGNSYKAGKHIHFVKDIGNTWYVGSDNGLFMSLDAGATWQKIPGLPGNDVKGIVVSDDATSSHDTTSDDPHAVIATPHSIVVTDLAADQLNAADPDSYVNIVMPTQNTEIYNSENTHTFPKGAIQTIQLCRNSQEDNQPYVLMGLDKGIVAAKLQGGQLEFYPVKGGGDEGISYINVRSIVCPEGGNYIVFGTDSGLWQAQWMEPSPSYPNVLKGFTQEFSGSKVYSVAYTGATTGFNLLAGAADGDKAELYKASYSLKDGIAGGLEAVKGEDLLDNTIINDITVHHFSEDTTNIMLSTESKGLLTGQWHSNTGAISSLNQYGEGKDKLPNNKVNSASIGQGVVMIATDAGLAKGDWLSQNGTIDNFQIFGASDLYIDDTSTTIDVRTLKVPQPAPSDQDAYILIGGKTGLYDIRMDRQAQKFSKISPLVDPTKLPSNNIQSIDFCDETDPSKVDTLFIGTAGGLATITNWDTKNPDVSKVSDLQGWSIVKVLFYTASDAYILTKNKLYTSQWRDSAFSEPKPVDNTVLSESLEYSSAAVLDGSSAPNEYNLVMGLQQKQ